MKQINTFTDRIVADLDPSVVKNSQWVFPTMNVRILNKGGQGFIFSGLYGSEQAFQVAEGFIVIGAVDYNGIAYIVSHNETSGESEVGCYPSPVAWTGDNTTFKNEYAPLLWNAHEPFRTDKFNFDINHPLDIITKPSFDGTTDLYICDYKNANIVINTCFDKAGRFVDRLLWGPSFDGRIKQIPSTKFNPRLGLKTIEKGGNLKPGTYFVFVRYSTLDYGRTSFVSDIGPIQIASGDTYATSISGMQEKDWLTNLEKHTDKQIIISIDPQTIDPGFDYLEVGIIRYTSMVENGGLVADVYLINKQFRIWDGQYISEIKISGMESILLLTLEEIIRPQNDFTISKTHTQLYNRYFGGNWKSEYPTYSDDAFMTYASKIKWTFIKQPLGEGANSDQYNWQGLPAQQYQDYRNTINYVGHFRGQIYPYGIVAVFDNGATTKAYPVGSLANKGLIQFPNWDSTKQLEALGIRFDLTDAKAYAEGNEEFAHVVGFYFVRGERIDNLLYQGLLMRGFWGIYSCVNINDENEPTNKNQKRYGFFVNTMNVGNSGTDPNTAAILPLYMGKFPFFTKLRIGEERYYDWGEETPREWIYQFTANQQTHQSKGVICTLPAKSTTPNLSESHNTPVDCKGDNWLNADDLFTTGGNVHYKNKYGLFCLDAAVDQLIEVPETGYAEEVFLLSHVSAGERNNLGLKPTTYALNLTKFSVSPKSVQIALSTKAKDIPINMASVATGVHRTKLGFASYFNGSTSGEIAVKIDENRLKNRSIMLPPYIGIQDTTINPLLNGIKAGHYFNDALPIYNIYKHKLEGFYATAVSSFNPVTTFYRKSSRLIRISDSELTTHDVWRGDCFVQTVWFRQIRHLGLDETHTGQNACGPGYSGWGSDVLDQECTWYQHGLLVGVILESKYNHAMRNNVVAQDDAGIYLEHTFYPKCINSGVYDIHFAVFYDGNYRHEAFQVNPGYNTTQHDRVFLGFDHLEPERPMIRENRIYFSDAHVPGGYQDGYRSIGLSSYRDFNIPGGSITKLIAEQSFLAAIQEKSIIQCYVGQKQDSNNETGNMATGFSEDFLSPYCRIISKFGSSHPQSIVPGLLGYYGVDFNERVIWRVNLKTTTAGSQYLDAEDIGLSGFISRWINDVVNDWASTTKINDRLPVDPLNGNGVVSAVDKAYKEILFNFLMSREDTGQPDSSGTPTNPTVFKYRTLVFSELKNAFIGEYEFYSTTFFNIDNDLYSVLPAVDDDTGKMTPTRTVHRHNMTTDPLVHDKFMAPVVSYIVNGIEAINEEGQQVSATKIQKVHRSVLIEVNDVDLAYVDFESQYQRSRYDHAIDKDLFYKNAEYTEHYWLVPVVVQDSAQENAYLQESEISGLWMKVTLEFDTSKIVNLRSTTNYFIDSES